MQSWDDASPASKELKSKAPRLPMLIYVTYVAMILRNSQWLSKSCSNQECWFKRQYWSCKADSILQILPYSFKSSTIILCMQEARWLGTCCCFLMVDVWVSRSCWLDLTTSQQITRTSWGRQKGSKSLFTINQNHQGCGCRFIFGARTVSPEGGSGNGAEKLGAKNSRSHSVMVPSA